MLSIKFSQGLFTAQTPQGTFRAVSLEKLLEQADPGAPAEKIAHAAEILEGIVGEDAGQIRHGVVS
jgi:hypothetical protein